MLRLLSLLFTTTLYYYSLLPTPIYKEKTEADVAAAKSAEQVCVFVVVVLVCSNTSGRCRSSSSR